MQKFSDSQKQSCLWQLGRHPMLQLLPKTDAGKDALEGLMHRVVLHRYPKNSLIFLQHSPATQLYFLLDGQVNCYRTLPNGQEYLIKIYQELNLINESVLWQHQSPVPNSYAIAKSPTSKTLALLLNQGNLHQLTAKATTPAIVASVPAQVYFDQIRAFELGELFVWFAHQMSQRVYQLLIGSDLLTFNTAKAKLSYYLLTHFSPNETIVFPTTQKQLAKQLGLRTETLSRTLHALCDQALIRLHKGGCQILDSDGLMGLINE